MTTKILTAIIIDDEPLAIQEMKTLLANYKTIEVIGQARNLTDAVQQVNTLQPDIIFLDIQLRNENGFDLIPLIPSSHQIIFVTAYDQFAINAFEINASDYLLKPVNPKRLARTIARVLNTPQPAPLTTNNLPYNGTLFVNQGKAVIPLKVKEVTAITADGDYTHIQSGAKDYLVLKTLKTWEEQLPTTNFMRVHRSTIIHIDKIRKIERWFNNTSKVWLEGIDEPFDISQRYTKLLKSRVVG